MTQEDLRKAGEDAVRRLARFCGLHQWKTEHWLVLIDELAWKGVVKAPGGGGWPPTYY